MFTYLLFLSVLLSVHRSHQAYYGRGAQRTATSTFTQRLSSAWPQTLPAVYSPCGQANYIWISKGQEKSLLQTHRANATPFLLAHAGGCRMVWVRGPVRERSGIRGKSRAIKQHQKSINAPWAFGGARTVGRRGQRAGGREQGLSLIHI